MKCPACNGTGVKTDHAAIGRRMRTLRKRAGASLRRVATGMDVSHTYLCQLEAGKRRWTSGLIVAFHHATQQETNKKTT